VPFSSPRWLPLRELSGLWPSSTAPRQLPRKPRRRLDARHREEAIQAKATDLAATDEATAAGRSAGPAPENPWLKADSDAQACLEAGLVPFMIDTAPGRFDGGAANSAPTEGSKQGVSWYCGRADERSRPPMPRSRAEVSPPWNMCSNARDPGPGRRSDFNPTRTLGLTLGSCPRGFFPEIPGV